MNLKHVFKKTVIKTHTKNEEVKPEVPEGLMKKCNHCKGAVLVEDVKKNLYMCPHCHNYFRIHARRRITMLTDTESFTEFDTELVTRNPLEFKGYEEKIEALKEKTGLSEAVITGRAKIEGEDVVLAVMDGRFMMASMGEVVGEKITRAVEYATREKLPVIIFTCSGGARMQEGIVSLMQMAKTSAALKRHSEAGQLYITVLTEPTTGGVTASFAMLGDIILAEPDALIGFAGPRVIEQTIGQKLPKGFQRSEFLLEHGFVDRIIERPNMKAELGALLKLHKACPDYGKEADTKFETILDKEAKKTVRRKLPAWDRVLLARDRMRPTAVDYIGWLFTGFMEMHGDRYFKDDSSVIGGIAYFHGMPVTVIAQEKGSTTKENIKRNFGMVSPDGYRKALRLMGEAEKFGRPVICIVDTPGAFCGIEAEERGQGEAIARNLYEMSDLSVPILSIVIGEGGSGGALALAVSDEVWMLENSIYSILSPEGFASILWKDSKRAKEAADVMKLTAGDLKELGIIERIIGEPKEKLTKDNAASVIRNLNTSIASFILNYTRLSKEDLKEHRYTRFRK